MNYPRIDIGSDGGWAWRVLTAGGEVCGVLNGAPTLPVAQLTAAELIAIHEAPRPVLIADLLRQGETMNIVSAPKVGKSWLVHDLCVAVAVGREWLGKATTQGRVLLIDAELHRETLSTRLRRIQEATGTPAEVIDRVDVWAVRGKNFTIDNARDVLTATKPGTYALIVFDALYRFLPHNCDENKNADIMRVYNTLDAIAEATGAAVVVVHHQSKGNQSEKAVTDVGSGAGAQSRAADTHLVLRQHEQDDVVVVDAAVRSFVPLTAFCIRNTRPGWALAPWCDPTALRRPGRKPKADTPDDPPPDKPKAEPWTPERFARDVVGAVPTIKPEVLARALAAGLGKGQAADLLTRAVSAGAVVRDPGNGREPHRFYTPAMRLEGGEGGRAVPPTPPGAASTGGGGSPDPSPPPSPLPVSCNATGLVVCSPYGQYAGRTEARDSTCRAAGRDALPTVEGDGCNRDDAGPLREG